MVVLSLRGWCHSTDNMAATCFQIGADACTAYCKADIATLLWFRTPADLLRSDASRWGRPAVKDKSLEHSFVLAEAEASWALQQVNTASKQWLLHDSQKGCCCLCSYTTSSRLQQCSNHRATMLPLFMCVDQPGMTECTEQQAMPLLPGPNLPRTIWISLCLLHDQHPMRLLHAPAK